MDGLLKEIAKLEKLTSNSSAVNKSKSPAINDSLDSLLQTLLEQKARIERGASCPEAQFQDLSKTIEQRKKEIDDRQKEVYNSLARYGKALDKRFPNPLPTYNPLFTSRSAENALEHVIAMHFLRSGQFSTAETFIEEFGVNIPTERQAEFIDLHRILLALRDHNTEPALEWARRNRVFLESRSSSLEFYLHRSEYIRLLLSSHPPQPALAIAYANKYLRPFFHTHATEFQRLLSCIMYLSRLDKSPYADLASPTVHFDLEPMFATEFSASLGMSKQAPLRVVGDVGGGGALAKIEKGRRIMRERKGGWSQADELPIEVPLPRENLYHSIFACPVSKDQSTEQNPPMMIKCGHVVSNDSLHKLSKVDGRVKCPYCPVESTLGGALRVHF
ncbi:uncharacterized protein STEHIDRAFT_74240 [Stereum hirsutum FP-91666 SS1]|uniref:uncharacterized protein n=1 Tax=Stereum hirsutum (strain FP-91666) TaxID=721885 RepID=UPI000440E2BD|nr:uncharacterized protein STEHIDRAFT_74240 [Stereum hirsutum FP-91666 SS1]EIM89889.1 hypothetical protein STEHIDRAFT_74240 [Stereum hirsutum FP-91666 SS1]